MLRKRATLQSVDLLQKANGEAGRLAKLEGTRPRHYGPRGTNALCRGSDPHVRRGCVEARPHGSKAAQTDTSVPPDELHGTLKLKSERRARFDVVSRTT